MQTSPRPLIVLIAALALTMAAAACGGDDDSSENPFEETFAAEIGTRRAATALAEASLTPPSAATAASSPRPGITATPRPEISMVIDMDAKTGGVQATREVRRGETFEVGVVIINAPVNVGGRSGGVNAFNFIVDYDKRVITASSTAEGAPIDRNPDLNEEALGGTAANWDCLPAPQGDLDDPGSIEGDGVAETGEALLSCFSTGLGRESGTITLGTITFTAVASGMTELTLRNVEVSDILGITYAHCDIDGIEPFVPCVPGSVSVE